MYVRQNLLRRPGEVGEERKLLSMLDVPNRIRGKAGEVRLRARELRFDHFYQFKVALPQRAVEDLCGPNPGLIL